MARYLRPRRGDTAIANEQNIKLFKGELFMEYPNGNIGREPGRLVVGDGNSSFSNIDYAPGSTNSFQPFITDPNIFIPRFENSTPAPAASATHDFNASTVAINDIGNGSTVGKKLPDIIGAIKKTLCLHNNSIAKLNRDIAALNERINQIENR